jgi:hypothetical protein
MMNQMLTSKRAGEAIAGSSRMGNEGGIGNAEVTWGHHQIHLVKT